MRNRKPKPKTKMAMINKSGKIEKTPTPAPAPTPEPAPAPTHKAGAVIGRKITLKPLQKMGFEAKARIGGMIVKTETVTTAYGDSTRFIGEIACRITEKGDWSDSVTTKAPSAFLPKAAEGLLSAALAAHANDPVFSGVEFAIEVSKIEDASSKTGYVWEVRSLREVAESDDKVLSLLA
jgi:hypothetical protein